MIPYTSPMIGLSFLSHKGSSIDPRLQCILKETVWHKTVLSKLFSLRWIGLTLNNQLKDSSQLRNTTKPSTNVAPAELMFRRNIRTRIPTLDKESQPDILQKAKQKDSTSQK